MEGTLTDYEISARNQDAAWRQQSLGKSAQALGLLNKPFEKPLELLMAKTPVGKAMEGVVRVVMDGASWSVSEDRIVETYRDSGYRVSSLEDVRAAVPLEEMDREASALAKRYRLAAGAEGAGAGAAAFWGPWAGAAALGADLVALTSVACRAVAHHAAVYGYRVDSLEQQATALAVLGGASSTDLLNKQLALKELQNIAVMVTQKKTWKELEERALVRALREAADRLPYTLTKGKLGGVVAGVAVVIGGGYKAWYVHNVCDWAYHIYREQHIDAKQPEPRSERLDRTPESVDADVIEFEDPAVGA